ncbi:MAG: phosphomannomutase/phosphoglucomutase [Alphaproteobacteria bacterium]|nr:phosphomannomutase/phosphoglucomutase [Alphaproteobacteria bacterium]
MVTHRFDPAILRANDIRGVVGRTLHTADARALGEVFGTVILERGGGALAVGRDGRTSSPDLEAALVTGLVSTGLTVHRTGTCPSPALYFAVHHLGLDGGVMVTGSHNPPEYNGFKMMVGVEPFSGSDLAERTRPGTRAPGQGRVCEAEVIGPWTRRLRDGLDISPALHVVWDCGNGAAGPALAELCRTLPGQHRILFDEVDGRFPNHHPDPTVAANLAQLATEVRLCHADLGIAFDGDADRIGVVDETGTILPGDLLLALFAEEVLREHPRSTVIADVKASQVLFDRITELGGKAVMWPSGHALVRRRMAETGAVLAGELSGHIFFADRYYGFDDAFYAALRLLEILGRRHAPLSEFRDGLPRLANSPELRFPCPDERKLAVVDDIRARLAPRRDIEICTIDGVRVRSADGWWLLRASNTQDALVARLEAADSDGLARLHAELSELLSRAGLTLPGP